MDPLTQGTLGALLPQSVSKRKTLVWATICGLMGGLAPDLDVFIRSETDPLLFLEYHRQFTHSFLFIPIGGAIVGFSLYIGLIPFKLTGSFRNFSLRTTVGFCMLGYATHALLDSCTTYGTVLLWPFSDTRFAWNLISIIDPLFTVPLLSLVILGTILRQKKYAIIGVAWAFVYLTLGFLQHRAAVDIGHMVAAKRGHMPVKLDAKPSFANILVWKVIYESDGRYYVDAVRVGYKPFVFEGESIPKLDVGRDFPWLDPGSVQSRDIERFRWFSRGYLAQHPNFPNRIIDIRYSLVPNEINSIWSIELSPGNQTRHVSYLAHRGSISESKKKLINMLFGPRTN